MLGSNYVFPRTANLIIVKYLEHLKKNGKTTAKVVAKKYTPLGHKDYANVVQDMGKADQDVIFSTINGDSNTNFYKELANQGITADKIPVVAVGVGEDNCAAGSLVAEFKGHLEAWNYFESIDTPANKKFVKWISSLWPKSTRRTRAASPTIRSRRLTSAFTSGNKPSKKPAVPTWTRCARPSRATLSSTPPAARSSWTPKTSTPTSRS